jgi:hypothetical protein
LGRKAHREALDDHPPEIAGVVPEIDVGGNRLLALFFGAFQRLLYDGFGQTGNRSAHHESLARPGCAGEQQSGPIPLQARDRIAFDERGARLPAGNHSAMTRIGRGGEGKDLRAGRGSQLGHPTGMSQHCQRCGVAGCLCSGDSFSAGIERSDILEQLQQSPVLLG